MLALEVEYLMGRVIAACHDDRRKVEWPPHPARLFAALVAAFKECELGEPVREALLWLETLPEPSIYANPPQHQGMVRDVHKVFVPINDSNDQQSQQKKKYSPISAGINFRRNRQERFFPAFTPYETTVYFIWNDTDVDKPTEQALQEVAQNVSYLGHSMSPVRVAVYLDVPSKKAPNLESDPQGSILLRTTARGRLEYLENLYSRRVENAGLQPRLGRISEYRLAGTNEASVPRGFFQHIYVLRKEQGCRLPLEAAFGLCSLLRSALLATCSDPLPASISGHLENGNPSPEPHMSVIPLANVGHRHADGNIMGFAVLFPENATANERKQLEQGLRRLETLKLGILGTWRVHLIESEALGSIAKTLRPDTYVDASQHWASVTPVAFGRHPKKQAGKDVLALIAQNCRDIGLPEPVSVNIVRAGKFHAVPLAGEFKQSADLQRCCYLKDKLLAHIELRFDRPVSGPLILGAGRFLGLGLCRPYRAKEAGHAN
ncbi:hypothetical protein A1507_21665 [Methylomonas koyamae]|uniref:Type I-U CRISPR-associated protein Cas5/Cas6 n=1 Tax=Methylomonas koyamae TaxID=702114 RepID=A0A177MZB5_9GAMM|nr:type I-U CRISPR-associated protein Csb2 [Methylomonas koyamae]OAI10310.1 hypothetical protein A1507_21665 [Methylomonas koyamae]